MSVAKAHHQPKLAAALMAVTTGAMLDARGPACAQCQYAITVIQPDVDCGVFPPSPTLGSDVNENAQVVGQYTTCGIGADEAFLWDGGPDVITLERPPGVGRAWANHINDAGLIVGTMACTGMGDRAFLHDGVQFFDLGTLPGGNLSRGRAINSLDQIVGSWGGPGGIPGAFLWQDGVMTDLNTQLVGPYSEADDINDAGQIVGWMGMGSVEGGEAFIWQDGQVTPLGQVGDSYFSAGDAINEAGQVVGWTLTGQFPATETRPFLWENGRMIDLGLLPGFERTAAADINEAGQVVGTAWGVDGNPNIEAAFICQNGVMTDLNDLIPPNFGVEIRWATAINNQGQITGRAIDMSGDLVAFLLTPIEPPVGDLYADCTVGIIDFLTLLALWGPCPTPCPPSCTADLDGDCNVGIVDFLLLLANWG